MPSGEDWTRKRTSDNHDLMNQTWYGAGARGVDYQSVQTKDKTANSWGSLTEGYPVYDTHGNNVGMVSRSGTSYSVGNERTYDAWGGVKTTSGDPPQQGYCASLGHREDLESSLVYMRARYYEPSTGRFVSEDPARDGSNWLMYANNDPQNHVDLTGQTTDEEFNFLGNIMIVIGYFLLNNTRSLRDINLGWIQQKVTDKAIQNGGKGVTGIDAWVFKLAMKMVRLYQAIGNLVEAGHGRALCGMAGYGAMLQGQMWLTEAEFESAAG